MEQDGLSDHERRDGLCHGRRENREAVLCDRLKLQCRLRPGANDAARVNRISERFAMSAEEVEKLRETILKAKEEKSQNTAYKERTDSTAEKDAHTVDDATLDEMMGNATPPQQTQHKQPVEISEDGPNPMKAGAAKSSPSAPLSEHSENTEMANTRERPSVRQQIKEIKEKRRERSSAPEKTPQTAYKQSRKRKREKIK